ncbi:hypothetical protein IEU95_10615 [Hoyosella rhizosphaerae]|uniref:Uncharacterized protein n=1 Tax=Hoyosella rhizosphaerae TaxID=1755582 RepID=A0A916TZ95_9ACTN|nr:hypothetical protein [Hoyosella rhizosphaerae]MBN4927287.1 hypothetical protein [Hoyosella rhizosphaerae]GGC52457.1 hypothetical protein GCM10011410_00990 [Hoyosella rhizosphaerae]
MKGLLAGIVAAIIAVVLGALLFFVLVDREETTEFPQDDLTFAIEGSQQNCAMFYGEPCDYDTQEGFNRWAQDLDRFVPEQRMGSFARDIGFTETSKISLKACVLTQNSTNTVDDLLAYTRERHPDATTAQVFPIWNAARWHLCPLER